MTQHLTDRERHDLHFLMASQGLDEAMIDLIMQTGTDAMVCAIAAAAEYIAAQNLGDDRNRDSAMLIMSLALCNKLATFAEHISAMMEPQGHA